MAQYLVEDYFGNINLYETVDKGEKKTILSGSYGRVDYINENRRLYRKNIVEPQIDKIKKEIFENGDLLWGRLEHPVKEEDLMAKYEDSAIGIYNLELKQDGTIFGESIVLDTFYGKELKAIIEAFQKLGKQPKIGMSTRGTGSLKEVKENNTSFFEVDNDFQLITVDAVSRPSAKVYTSAIAESIGNEWLKKGNIYVKNEENVKKFYFFNILEEELK